MSETKKVNKIRFCNLISTKLKLHNAFILPHFQYCTTVWHFCSARNCEKLESLNKRALRIVLMIKFCPTSGYYIIQKEQLYTTKAWYNIYKSFPKYLKHMLSLRQSVFSSRRTNILPICKPTTTTYSLNSFRYFAFKKWNSLPNNVKSEPTLSGFRRLLKAISFQT